MVEYRGREMSGTSSTYEYSSTDPEPAPIVPAEVAEEARVVLRVPKESPKLYPEVRVGSEGAYGRDGRAFAYSCSKILSLGEAGDEAASVPVASLPPRTRETPDTAAKVEYPPVFVPL